MLKLKVFFPTWSKIWGLRLGGTLFFSSMYAIEKSFSIKIEFWLPAQVLSA